MWQQMPRAFAPIWSGRSGHFAILRSLTGFMEIIAYRMLACGILSVSLTGGVLGDDLFIDR